MGNGNFIFVCTGLQHIQNKIGVLLSSGSPLSSNPLCHCDGYQTGKNALCMYRSIWRKFLVAQCNRVGLDAGRGEGGDGLADINLTHEFCCQWYTSSYTLWSENFGNNIIQYLRCGLESYFLHSPGIGPNSLALWPCHVLITLLFQAGREYCPYTCPRNFHNGCKIM